MIKPRYIKSLTFLLLCNMALWGGKRLLSEPPRLGFGFGPFRARSGNSEKVKELKIKEEKYKWGGESGVLVCFCFLGHSS